MLSRWIYPALVLLPLSGCVPSFDRWRVGQGEDSGVARDSGSLDAGLDAGVDAERAIDAAMIDSGSVADSGPPDAGVDAGPGPCSGSTWTHERLTFPFDFDGLSDQAAGLVDGEEVDFAFRYVPPGGGNNRIVLIRRRGGIWSHENVVEQEDFLDDNIELYRDSSGRTDVMYADNFAAFIAEKAGGEWSTTEFFSGSYAGSLSELPDGRLFAVVTGFNNRAFVREPTGWVPHTATHFTGDYPQLFRVSGEPRLIFQGGLLFSESTLEYRILQDGNWGPAESAVRRIDPGPWVGITVSAQLDSRGGAHVAYFYEETSNQQLRYAYLAPGGTEWTHVIVDGTRRPLGTNVRIAVDRFNRPHILYRARDSRSLRHASPPTWLGESIHLSDGTPYAADVDEDGVLRVLWKMHEPPAINQLHISQRCVE